jgi:cell division protein ZapA
MATVTVKINGIEYNLKGEENDEYLKHVAEYVEGKLKDITNKNSKLSTAAAAVLTAINVADELFKGNKEYNELLSDYDGARIQNKALMKEVEELKTQLVNQEEINSKLQVQAETEALEQEIVKLKEQLTLLEEECRVLLSENQKLKETNKEIKFNNQTLKYKLMDIQKKYVDSQIIIAKEKANRNPLLNVKNKAQ